MNNTIDFKGKRYEVGKLYQNKEGVILFLHGMEIIACPDHKVALDCSYTGDGGFRFLNTNELYIVGPRELGTIEDIWEPEVGKYYWFYDNAKEDGAMLAFAGKPKTIYTGYIDVHGNYWENIEKIDVKDIG